MLALLGSLACVGPAKTPPSLVLIVVDTLRADALGPSTPHVGALAERGVRFEQAVAESSWTGPSTATLLTGRHAPELGIYELRDPLPPEALTLARVLDDAGFATGAVVSNSIVGPDFGYDRGYDVFEHEPYVGEDRRPEFTADLVTDRALTLLEELPAPFFLYVHYTDPHAPYAERERRAGSAAPRAAALPAAYRAEVAFVDRQLGRLLDRLPERTIVAFTSDHGEEFREHGGVGHARTLFQEVLHVPLVIVGPGVPEAVRVERAVSHVDVLPTLLDLLDIERPPRRSGRSLLPLFDPPGRESDPRVVLSSFSHGDRAIRAARRGNWKLIHRPGSWRLYHLGRDPGETRSETPAHPVVVRDLADALAAQETRARPRSERPGPAIEARVEALRALGYTE